MPDCELNRVGGTSCELRSVPFAETLQKSCGTLVDAKGHPVVDGKSRLSPVAQDVLSMFPLASIVNVFCSLTSLHCIPGIGLLFYVCNSCECTFIKIYSYE